MEKVLLSLPLIVKKKVELSPSPFILPDNFRINTLENLILEESLTFSTSNMLKYKNKLYIEYTYNKHV